MLSCEEERVESCEEELAECGGVWHTVEPVSGSSSTACACKSEQM